MRPPFLIQASMAWMNSPVDWKRCVKSRVIAFAMMLENPRSRSGTIVSGGTFSLKGEGAWVVDCSEPE